FGPRESPYQAAPPGWMHQQLYFMRLYGRGASPSRPLVTQLSDNTPSTRSCTCSTCAPTI
ncbi:MAG: hypothetical protein ACTHQQ_11795, partial [Solirubrobacteraceae bacterium]